MTDLCDAAWAVETNLDQTCPTGPATTVHRQSEGKKKPTSLTLFVSMAPVWAVLCSWVCRTKQIGSCPRAEAENFWTDLCNPHSRDRDWGAGRNGEVKENAQSSACSTAIPETQWDHQVLKIHQFLWEPCLCLCCLRTGKVGIVCCLKWKLADADDLFYFHCLSFLSFKWFSHHNLMTLFSLTQWF